MSLFSILNGTSSSSSTVSTSSTMSTLLAQIEAQKAASGTTTKTGETSSTGSSSSVSITVDAQRAASEAKDAKKDASALVAELRKAFDEAYGKGDTPDTGELSGRALALVATNEGGGFSRAEVAAAKAELRDRDRASALAVISSGDLTSSTLITYNKDLLAQRASMSPEERALRDANPKLR